MELLISWFYFRNLQTYYSICVVYEREGEGRENTNFKMNIYFDNSQFIFFVQMANRD